MVRLTGCITNGIRREVKKCMYNFRQGTSKVESVYESVVGGTIIVKCMREIGAKADYSETQQ
jgi:hypothetical protein